MGAIRRSPVVATAGLAVLGLLASGCGLFGGGDSSEKAAQGVSTSAAVPTDPTSPATAPTADATPGGDPSAAGTAASTAAGGDATAPGAFASDGTTPLNSFPSLQGVWNAFGKSKHVTTTIDPRYQNAAATALAKYPSSAMVVIQPSTGHILAIAEQRLNALQVELAPGSTFKVVTTEDLLRNGLTAHSPMPCTATAPGYPEVKNDSPSLTNPNADLTYAFTWSCNTSFVNKLGVLADSGSPLGTEATKYFGLNQPWDLGLGPATYGAPGSVNVPSATGGEFAAEMFGQGRITMSPLNMASVAATVEYGRFRQPVLIDGQHATASATPLDSRVDATLKQLMQETVTQGTAKSLKGLGNGTGAKTGTAEPGGNGPNNSWMIAFQGDVAVACVVQGGNFGDESAGPAIAAMFAAAGR